MLTLTTAMNSLDVNSRLGTMDIHKNITAVAVNFQDMLQHSHEVNDTDSNGATSQSDTVSLVAPMDANADYSDPDDVSEDESQGNDKRAASAPGHDILRFVLMGLLAVPCCIVGIAAMVGPTAKYIAPGPDQLVGGPRDWRRPDPKLCLADTANELPVEVHAPGLTFNATFNSIDKNQELRRPQSIKEYAMDCGGPDSGLDYLQDQWITLSSGLDESELLAGYTHHVGDSFDPLRGELVQDPIHGSTRRTI